LNFFRPGNFAAFVPPKNRSGKKPGFIAAAPQKTEKFFFPVRLY
jgi:hypothetical protein